MPGPASSTVTSTHLTSALLALLALLALPLLPLAAAASAPPGLHGHAGHAAAVVVCVLHQVDHDPFEAALVHADAPGLHGGIDVDLGRASRPGTTAPPCGRSPVSTERCTSSATRTSSRKMSTEPASARDISSRSATMRWKRRRSSLRSCRARWERGGRFVAVGLEHLDGGGQGGEGGAQLVAHVGVEARLALDALLQLVDHGVEREGEALEVGVGRLEVEPGVEVARGDGAGGPGDDGQRPQRAGAGEAAERNAENGGDAAGDEEGEGEHAQRVVEVGQVEDVEVVGVHGGDGDPDHDLGRALRGAVGLGGRGPVEDDVAQLVGDGGGGHAEGRVVGLGAVEEHRVGVGPRVDVAEQPTGT